MIADLRPYPTYRDSGVPWLGAIPSHWDLLPNRAIFREVLDRGFPNEEMLSVTISQGVIKQASLIEHTSKKDSSNLDRTAYKLVFPGDIVYNKMRAWQGAVGVSRYRGLVSPAYIVMRPKSGGNVATYFANLFRTPLFANEAERWSYGITSDQWSLRSEQFYRIYSAVPPVGELHAINNFLDYADRRIKRYIRAKRQLIGLLNEQKQAIIHRAVTRGLDPNVRLKPSGVEWLGDIPEHWRIAPLKTAVTIQSGLTLGKNYPAGTVLEPMPYLRVANVQVGYLNLSEVKTLPVPKWEAQRCLLRPNDVLMTEGGDPDKLGRGCLWQGQIEPCLHQNHIFAVRTAGDQLRPRFLEIYLSTKMARDYFIRSAKQTTNLASTNKTAIGNLASILPPVNEQDALLSLIDGQVAKQDQALTAAQKEIDLLREYRTRLIADVVTGKLDVRAAAAALPAEPEVDEELPELDEMEAEDGDDAELADAEA